MFGLYFVAPHGPHPLVVSVAWQALAELFLVALLWVTFRTFQSMRSKRTLRSELLLAADGGALAVLTLMLISGRFWAAGKGLSMVAPFLFFPLVTPLFVETSKALWRRVPAIIVVLAYLGFGLARPVAAAGSDGIGYASPYPSSQNPEGKQKYDWGLKKYRTVLKGCRAISLDLADPALERYVQLYLTDIGARWSSVRPLNDYFGIGGTLGLQPQLPDPDCLVTTGHLADIRKPFADTANISLARHR
jgi:hypothetical protein